MILAGSKLDGDGVDVDSKELNLGDLRVDPLPTFLLRAGLSPQGEITVSIGDRRQSSGGTIPAGWSSFTNNERVLGEDDVGMSRNPCTTLSSYLDAMKDRLKELGITSLHIEGPKGSFDWEGNA